MEFTCFSRVECQAVRFFNNKQHPKFYPNRETLSKAIRREAANGMNGELFYCRNVHVQKNQKHYEMQFKIKVLSDGTIQKETFFHSDMTEGEQVLFTWYYDQCVGHDVYGSLHRKKEVKPFIDFLHAYWAMENRSYTYVSCDDSATNYNVMVSVDGLEDHPLRKKPLLACTFYINKTAIIAVLLLSTEPSTTGNVWINLKKIIFTKSQG